MAISRRKFLRTALTASATGLIANRKTTAAADTARDLLVLESAAMVVAIDRVTGCVDRVESTDHAWQMRGGGMRLHVPAPDHRFHYLSEHHAATPHIDSDGTQAMIIWSGFESERMGKLDIDVKETIQLVGNAVHFRYEIRNGGLHAVAFVNMSHTEPIVCEVVLDRPKSASMRWISPEQPETQPWLGNLELAPGSAAVVLEG